MFVSVLILILWQVFSATSSSTACRQALACEGHWDNFTSAGWRPIADNITSLTAPINTTLVELLSHKRLRWIAMVGDSNMRYLFFELVRRLCVVESKCTLHAPFFDTIVKASGDRKDITTILKSRENKIGGLRAAHLDFDVFIRNAHTRAGKGLRVSFRMVVGTHAKTMRSLDNLDRQFCSSDQVDKGTGSSNPCVREGIPMHNSSFTASPSALIFNQGYWNLTSISDRNITSQLFAKLAELHKRGRSRVMWTTLFHWRLDVMREFDAKHFVDFSRDCNVSNTIQRANVMCRDLAAQYDVEVLDLDNMALLVDDLFAKSVTKMPSAQLTSTQQQSCNSLIAQYGIKPGRSWGSAPVDGEARKTWASLGCDSVATDPLIQKKTLVTPDGVHQEQQFYGAAVKQIVITLLECSRFASTASNINKS